nr:ABC transporter substrate-binding protein [Pseudenhygromyxa sp. WMMC2535]
MLAEVHRTLALTLVRSGDPQRAVEELDLLEGWGSVERETLRGARAVALDRQGDQSAALAAFVAWRELLTDDSPDAGYAEDRIRALVTGLDRATIEELAKNAPGPDAADCLRATIGIAPGDQSPTWVSKCRPLPARIGILLPRSGKLAALADAQFAAAVAAVTVLGSERPVSVMWRDSGSTAASTKAAATQLLADGAEVIVGPVGADNVRAAVSVAGHERFLLPGESVSSARGIAPSLEQRARTLVAHAADHAPAAATSVLVMIPENGYGRRAQKALESDQGSFSKSLKFMTYTSSTKSFSPILRPVADALQKGAPVVVVDALPRTELIARQLRRDGLRIAGGSVDQEGAEVAVYAMGEGLSPERVGAKHESLDGVVLAPVAAPDAESRDFEDRYLAQQGLPPDDQALLVWSALEAAWSGASSTHEPQVQLVRVEGGRVVALGTP